jgi:formylglycine-generating enzyme required for sulfatase activity
MRTSFQICILSLVALIIGVATPRVNAQCTGNIYPNEYVDAADLAQLLADWGPCTKCPGDIDRDGAVTGNDLGQLLGGWGPCAPFIASVAPVQGSIVGGTPITISGAYFTSATSVSIGGAPATNLVVVSSTTITAVTPAGTLGPADVVVTTPAGTLTSLNIFSYVSNFVPAWATLLEATPDPAVVTDANLRAAIVASGLAWRIKATLSNIEMLLVPAGIFTMGCSESTQYGCNSDESPAHQVTLMQAFYMGLYEVTQAEWRANMGSNPSAFSGFSDSPSRPVEVVSWNKIQIFNSVTGLRLPTEAEWEYAYRAGTTTAFHSYALSPTEGQPNGFDDDTLLDNIAWYTSNSGNQTHAVGGKLANRLGLHDMSGNVWEWCQDWYGPYSSGSVTNPTGPATGTGRLLRGGSWYNNSNVCRGSRRGGNNPNEVYTNFGFRVVRTP